MFKMNVQIILGFCLTSLSIGYNLYGQSEKPEHLQIILMPASTAPGAKPAAVEPAAPAAPAALENAKDEAKPEDGASKPSMFTAFFDKNTWIGACNTLGNTLLVGKGPWGFGAFNSFSCYYDRELQSGSRDASNYVLRFAEDAAGLHVTMEYTPKGAKNKIVITQIDLPKADRSYSYFSDPDLADLTAYAILDSMPGMMYISKTEKTGVTATVMGRQSRENAKFLVPNPPDNMNLQEIQFDTKKSKFKEIPVSNMNFLGYRIPGKEEQSKTLGREVVTPLWSVDPKAEGVIAKSPLWAHNILGAGARKAELNKLVDSAYRFLALGAAPDANLLTGAGNDVTDANFRKNLMRGAVAARMGLSLVKAPALLKKTKIIGIVAETRPRGFGGFRFYFDMVPEVSQNVISDGRSQKTEFLWNRVALGWSFGFDMQRYTKSIIDYVDITPKASIWNMTSKLQITDDAGSDDISTFKAKNDPSLGWEIGLEKTLARVLVRGWYGADFLGLFSRLEQRTSVKMHRFGVDSWIAGPQFSLKSYFRTSFLAFFWHENTSFSKKDVNESANDGIAGMDLRFAYLGGGVGIQW